MTNHLKQDPHTPPTNHRHPKNYLQSMYLYHHLVAHRECLSNIAVLLHNDSRAGRWMGFFCGFCSRLDLCCRKWNLPPSRHGTKRSADGHLATTCQPSPTQDKLVGTSILFHTSIRSYPFTSLHPQAMNSRTCILPKCHSSHSPSSDLLSQVG